MSDNKDVDTLQVNRIICESVACQTGFCVVKFLVPKDAINGSEAVDFVHGRFHVDNHFKKKGGVLNIRFGCSDAV